MTGAWQSDWQQAADERQALLDENQRLRDGLKVAREWLAGWASAEPYLGRINALLKQGSSAAECEAHNLEVAGATPAPASSPQAPIACIRVGEDDTMEVVHLYAPGLPPGEHDLYCEPASVAPYLPGNSSGQS